MTNGHNDWGVRYSHIAWFEKLLQNHGNAANVHRHDDIIFEIDRKKQSDHLKILCCNEYTIGLTLVLRGLHEFGAINIFYIGGGWCGYTRQAKEYCLEHRIGLFVTDEIHGALWRDYYWLYHKRDDEGNPAYFSAEQSNVTAVFGFGSHFRGKSYNDVDILVVLKPGCASLLPTYYSLKEKLELLARRLGVAIDLTVLTWEEFAEKPLRDMDSLVEIVR